MLALTRRRRRRKRRRGNHKVLNVGCVLLEVITDRFQAFKNEINAFSELGVGEVVVVVVM